jgi:hypothetical protein
MPEIPDGYELMGISTFGGESVAPILTEPQEFEDHVVSLKNNGSMTRRLSLYLVRSEDLAYCPNEGAVKE